MREGPVAVVRVDDIEPVQTELLKFGGACVRDPLRAEVVATAIGQAGPNELREGLNQRSLPRLAGAQRSLRFDVIGDVDAFHEYAAAVPSLSVIG